MSKLLTILFTTVVGFGLTLPAYAAQDGMGARCQMHGKNSFDEADTNHDGSLDKAEVQAMHDKNFEKMDTNHDGVLSKEEMKACGHRMGGAKAMHERRTKEFSAADTDNDGTLTKEEAQKLPRISKNFDAIDSDKDGTLDRDEVHRFMQELKAK
ncbi:transaldolase/EF-hand domain-containing protein [mine drainage metagenome]|uniref:Transaldolase/EF-hand domain-containing protein n=1 Tax=mine drainage metagenome TaxID=410659 RepID=A0A1J5RMB1_9ZZZZ